MQSGTIHVAAPAAISSRARRWGLRLAAPALLLAVGLAPAAEAAELVPLDRPLEAQGYELVRVVHGVKVYKFRGGGDIRLAAEGVFPAPIADVREIVTDYRAQQGNINRVTESRVLRRGAGWLTVYQHLNLPVIADRDFILVVRWGQENGIPWVAFDATRDQGPPPRPGIVRVVTHSGSWQLRSVEGGRATLVRFQTRIDFAGSVPRWMVRGGAAKELPHLFTSLCKLTDPKHRSHSCL